MGSAPLSLEATLGFMCSHLPKYGLGSNPTDMYQETEHIYISPGPPEVMWLETQEHSIKQ